MLIKYTGPKTVKTVEYNNLAFTFIASEEGSAPTCDVKDPSTLKFLLNADMKGLFVPATSGTPKADAANAEEAEAHRKASDEALAKVEQLEGENKELKEENKVLKETSKTLSKENKELKKKIAG